MKIIPYTYLLFLFISCNSNNNIKKDTEETKTNISQHSKEIKDKTEINHKIDNYINQTSKVHGIPGVALAVIQNGKIIHKEYYGKANIEHDLPVEKNTMFRVYSTTKLLTATGVFQLIEKGKISLEDSISKYIDNLPQSWQVVKIKNLLTHSSGLPNLIQYENELSDSEMFTKLYEEKIEFPVDTKFSYNQTNYWLLSLIIEKITTQKFDEYILKNQFFSSKSGVLFSSNSLEVIPNRISKYNFDIDKGKYITTTYNNDPRGHSGNGLNITLEELITWNQNFDNGQFLKAETNALMWNEFNFKNEKDKFLHGWGIYPINGKSSIGFTGGGVSGFRKFKEDNITIILLTNGYKFFPVHNRIINHIAGIVDNDLIDNESLQKEQITTNFLMLSIKEAIDHYKLIKKANPNMDFENTLNSIGYTIAKIRINDAIAIFNLNVKENPDSWNTYDSLGEGYEIYGDIKNAIVFYQKSVDLNPKNMHGIEKIKTLKKELLEQ
ncbi:serine hydrolase domain-containing protein [Aquimarina algiphila]|uniref:serine hydrolase domain-containing protein n=1 Tax=Aquimarina algiphila TaxID=2047982 RepID=UPI00232BA82A|nr:serine hydrolase domain-containing protein [Aquimarina algiphila]